MNTGNAPRDATKAQEFYGTVPSPLYSRRDILEGKVVRLNPALITITDGLVASSSPQELQRVVIEKVTALLGDGIVRTFHVDVNYEDYSGFGRERPDINSSVFTPVFTAQLTEVLEATDAFLNLHLLTDHPLERLQEFNGVLLGAVCFQLEVVREAGELSDLVGAILDRGACASPVIETIGSEATSPWRPDDALSVLTPVLPAVGMLTVQATGTASRSNLPSGVFDSTHVRYYLEALRLGFSGPIQLQGGITTATVGDAVSAGARFLVAGTQIFRNREGLAPSEVVRLMLAGAADALAGT